MLEQDEIRVIASKYVRQNEDKIGRARLQVHAIGATETTVPKISMPTFDQFEKAAAACGHLNVSQDQYEYFMDNGISAVRAALAPYK